MSNLVNIELVIVISESDVYNFVKSCSQSDAYAQVLIQSTAGTANRRQNRKENKHWSISVEQARDNSKTLDHVASKASECQYRMLQLL